MGQNIEGTIVLDGLVEGRLPADGDGEDKLRKWVKFAAQSQLVFSLDVQGGSFSILPDNQAVRADAVGPDPGEVVASLLRELQKLFPVSERSKLMSTVRSREYRAGKEIQTLYAFTPADVKTQARTVDADTVAPEAPLTRREMVRMGVTAGVVLLALFGISSIFISWGDVFRNFIGRVKVPDAEKVEVDVGAFGPYLTVDKKRIYASKDVLYLELTLKRTAAFPRSDAELNALTTRPSVAPTTAATTPSTPPAAPTGPYPMRLLIDDLARGEVRLEYADEKGEHLGSAVLRVRGLREKETVSVSIPFPREPRPTRVILTY